MRTVAFCEVDDYACRVLRKHWPHVPNLGDIRAATIPQGFAEVVCGGFPCQDISKAGKREGITGKRSGLWREFARIICQVEPRYAIVENVSDLLVRGMGDVLGDLAELGYDAQWRRIRGWEVGLPHDRSRVFIVANRHGERQLQPGWGIGYERRWSGDESKAIDWVLSRGGVLRSHDGIPAALDRIEGCGNAIIPQIAESIGRAIMGKAS